MEDETITVYSLWVAAYLFVRNVRYISTVPGEWIGLQFSNADGEATAALEEWDRPGLEVNAKRLIRAFHAAKGLVFNARSA